MGGYGSGRWRGRTVRRSVEEATAVRIRDVAHAYRPELADAAEVILCSGAAGPGSGSRLPPVGVRIDGPVSALVELAGVPQPYGGVRWWFVCPRCAARRATLYVVPTPALGCRGCLGLTYLTQRCAPVGREQVALQRIAALLGAWMPDAVPDLPGKPPGMHWRTYDRLADAFEAAEARRCRALETVTLTRLLKRAGGSSAPCWPRRARERDNARRGA